MTDSTSPLLLSTFTAALQRHDHSLSGRYLVAVSGGVDSVTLCELCRRANLSFAIAHCNFGLRGEESNRDEKFVRSLADRYSVAFFIQRFDTEAYAATGKRSVQTAARELRYMWFEELRKEEGFAWVLLGHHADDNAETILFQFLRGTGLDGLLGMKERNGFLLRPLLQVRRTAIGTFAATNHLAWVEDSSNASTKYSRNHLRHEVWPKLQTLFPHVTENILHNAERLQGVHALYQEAVTKLKAKLCVRKGEELHLPVLRLLQYQHTALPYEILRDYGFGESAMAELFKLAMAESGRYIANDRWRIIRHRRWLIIAPLAPKANTYVIEKDDTALRFAGGELWQKHIKKDAFTIDPSPHVAQLDAKDIAYPLVLRRWRPGDYFYPLGMRKKKKLARFFIDNKLSKTEKEAVWVLESHKRIVWVVGHRIDDRFKVTDATTQVLRFSVSSPSAAGTTAPFAPPLPPPGNQPTDQR